MAKINEVDITSLTFQEGSAPSTPASTKWKAYFKTTGLFIIDDAGVETGPFAAAGTPIVHGWLARHSADQAFNTSTETDMVYDTDTVDTDAYHFTSAAALTGTVAKTASSGAIVGTGTSFTTELTVDQVISIPGTAVEYVRVTTITDNTHIDVLPVLANNASGQTATRRSGAVVIPAGLGGYYDISFQAKISAATQAYLIVRQFTSTTAASGIVEASINSSTSGATSKAWVGVAQNLSLTAGTILIVRGIATGASNMLGSSSAPVAFSGRLVGT
jgi:hypothetical protein